jgi:hypothetical protein
MALREAGEDNQPNWRDRSIAFLQLSRLDLTLAESPTTSIITYQNDDRWGLYREDGLPPSRLCTDEADCIFRSRTFDELPRGQIRGVLVSLNEGDIEEIRLDVEGREIRLWAGEVYEENDGSLRVVTMDESVLVQVDGRHPETTTRANCVVSE